MMHTAHTNTLKPWVWQKDSIDLYVPLVTTAVLTMVTGVAVSELFGMAGQHGLAVNIIGVAAILSAVFLVWTVVEIELARAEQESLRLHQRRLRFQRLTKKLQPDHTYRLGEKMLGGVHMLRELMARGMTEWEALRQLGFTEAEIAELCPALKAS